MLSISLGAIQVLRNAFFGKLVPHPPPRNANNIEPYTFVTLSSGKFDTPPPHQRYVTLEWPLRCKKTKMDWACQQNATDIEWIREIKTVGIGEQIAKLAVDKAFLRVGLIKLMCEHARTSIVPSTLMLTGITAT